MSKGRRKNELDLTRVFTNNHHHHEKDHRDPHSARGLNESLHTPFPQIPLLWRQRMMAKFTMATARRAFWIFLLLGSIISAIAMGAERKETAAPTIAAAIEDSPCLWISTLPLWNYTFIILSRHQTFNKQQLVCTRLVVRSTRQRPANYAASTAASKVQLATINTRNHAFLRHQYFGSESKSGLSENVLARGAQRQRRRPTTFRTPSRHF